MKSFLDKVADKIISYSDSDLTSYCIVFPSRRAGLFLKKYLSQKIDKPLWSPSVFGIEDFIQKLCPFVVSDKLTLVFELFEVYKKYFENETFDRFYGWGEMMLDDFDQIDKNLVDPEVLFRNIVEMKGVDDSFLFDFDDNEYFKKFWNSFSNLELSKTQNDYLHTWKVLPNIYKEYTELLISKNRAYEGMTYRKVLDDLISDKIDLKWKKIIFAGLNSLNKAEKEIIKFLLESGKAEILWDADKYYIDDVNQEAGVFLNSNFKYFGTKELNWIEDELGKSSKNLKVTGVPLSVGQAKAMASDLKSVMEISSGLSEEKTAVILPDPSLLLPVLYSIPSGISSVNVTMGYSIKYTPVYNLIELLNSLQTEKYIKVDNSSFYHKNVLKLLLHTYIKLDNPAYIFELVNIIRTNNYIYVPLEIITSVQDDCPDILKLIFKKTSSVSETIDYLYNILNHITDKLELAKEIEGYKIDFELQYFYKVYESINNLRDHINEYSSVLSNEIFWKILIEVLGSVKIPFTGEPLKGLQVMGLLETRSLDFDNVFILSMNEDILPPGRVHSSFIPYNLRKAFGLPVYDDNDNISAYYFYRLLQKAKNIYLYYNTEVDKLSSGEKSRFILQLEHELIKRNKNIKFENCISTFNTEYPVYKEITIPKNEEMISTLAGLKGLSPSGLAMYINCPLQFYLDKIAGIDIESELEESFEGATFGSLLHKVMQIIYKDYCGIVVNKDTISSIKKDFIKNYDNIISLAASEISTLKNFDMNVKGKNYLMKGVLKKLVLNLMDNEINDAPFEMIDVEAQLNHNISFDCNNMNFNVNFHGRADRIDIAEGIYRIIDYKTGKNLFKNQGKDLFEDYIPKLFNNIDYKENFQAYFYAYLFKNTFRDKQVKIGLYVVRDLEKGIKFLGNNIITDDEIIIFENSLKLLLNELFDINKPFSQTKDIDNCKYCSFKTLCYR